MDSLSKAARSKNMAAIKSKNTKPEIFFRSLVHSMGYRYSLHRKDLPGKPDLFFKMYSAAIFVHGCFWHQHTGCKEALYPKSNRAFWRLKLSANAVRDKQHILRLRKLGYKIMIVWECQIGRKYADKLESCIKKFLRN